MERLIEAVARDRGVVATEFPYRPPLNLQFWFADVAYSSGDVIPMRLFGDATVGVDQIFVACGSRPNFSFRTRLTFRLPRSMAMMRIGRMSCWWYTTKNE
jgi:hypothetical protein